MKLKLHVVIDGLAIYVKNITDYPRRLIFHPSTKCQDKNFVGIYVNCDVAPGLKIGGDKKMFIDNWHHFRLSLHGENAIHYMFSSELEKECFLSELKRSLAELNGDESKFYGEASDA